jgi:hypothetical protein
MPSDSGTCQDGEGNNIPQCSKPYLPTYPSIYPLAATILGLKEMEQVGKPPQTSSARPSWGLKAVRIGVTARPSTSKQDTFLVQKKGDTNQGFQCVNLWGHVNVSICKNVHTNIASFYLSIYLPIYLIPTYLSIYPSTDRSIYRSIYLYTLYHIVTYSSSTAQGGGGSFKNRKPIVELVCESRMAE